MRITDEMKKEINRLANAKDVIDLKNGHYSKVYLIKDNEGKYFHFRFKKENEILKVIYNKNLKLVSCSLSLNKIDFYDNELKMNLSIDKSIFDKRCDEEVNFLLSNEQKELLAQGKDITLEVNSNTTSQISKQQTSKSVTNLIIKNKLKIEYKNFVADFSFFLGKTSNLLTAKKQQNSKLSISNISSKIE